MDDTLIVRSPRFSLKSPAWAPGHAAKALAAISGVKASKGDSPKRGTNAGPTPESTKRSIKRGSYNILITDEHHGFFAGRVRESLTILSCLTHVPSPHYRTLWKTGLIRCFGGKTCFASLDARRSRRTRRPMRPSFPGTRSRRCFRKGHTSAKDRKHRRSQRQSQVHRQH